MRLRKATRIWLGVFLVAAAGGALLDRIAPEKLGCLVSLLQLAAVAALLVLIVRGTVALFRLVVRRTTLRLAFSYFLIGVVPIPLLAALLFLASYIVAHQYMANRIRREVTAVGEAALARTPGRSPSLPGASARGGKVESSDVAWLKPGTEAAWIENIARPGFLVADGRLWLVAPAGPGSVRFLDLSDPGAPWLQDLANRTGYTIRAEASEASTENRGFTVRTDEPEKPGPRILEPPERRPDGAAPPGQGLIRREWIHAFYLETVLDAPPAAPRYDVAVLIGTASPQLLTDQLFAQGVKDVGRIFRVAFVAVAGILLIVYLQALVIAFVLVGSIARNVNRLTRATQAVARGDFSVRVHSKSRDQIGDLARSFDGMAESIQKLLVQTAEKERLQSELSIARTIQHKLLPPAEASRPGFRVLALFEPVAEIGGDYYDYLEMPDGRAAIALGDVSGHGLPTGLLVAMAKAALATLLEAGHCGAELFGRLNDLIHRSTDPRHYMTLALLAYDPGTRRGLLTNAGQLAPYRITGGRVEALTLPGFPLGLFPDRTFPEREFAFASGDILVLLTDGFVEAADAKDEAFGFERVEAVLAAHAGGGAAAIRDGLLAAVRAHTGERPADDDRTLLILTLE